jgi:hypothetical protein
MNHKEMNLRIAHFMGAEKPFTKSFETRSRDIEIEFIEIKSAPLSYRKEGVFLHIVDTLSYHNNIVWQLPVIDKIESEGFNFSIISDDNFYWSEIKSKKDPTLILPHGHYSSREEAIYKGICEYLNYFKK